MGELTFDTHTGLRNDFGVKIIASNHKICMKKYFEFKIIIFFSKKYLNARMGMKVLLTATLAPSDAFSAN